MHVKGKPSPVGNTHPHRAERTRLQIVGVPSHSEWHVLGTKGWTSRLKVLVHCEGAISGMIASKGVRKDVSEEDAPQLPEILLRSEKRRRQ